MIAWPVVAETEPAVEPQEPTAAPIETTSTVGDVAFTVMREQCVSFVALGPEVRTEGQPGSVHDMRVAVRRLRAALALFKEALPSRAARYRSELRWLTSSLGPVRELDVLREQIARWVEKATPDERAGLEALDLLLADRRDAAHARLVRSLDSRRYAHLAESLATFLGRGPSARSPAATLPAVVVVPELLAKRYRAVRKAGRHATKSSTAGELHALRIRAKRFRYALEFIAPMYPAPAKTMIRRLTRLQDVLGDINDAEVAIVHLRSLGEGAGRKFPPEALFAMGRVAERHSHKAAGLRRSFPGAFTGIEGKRWKQLKREMERRRRAGVVPIVS